MRGAMRAWAARMVGQSGAVGGWTGRLVGVGELVVGTLRFAPWRCVRGKSGVKPFAQIAQGKPPHSKMCWAYFGLSHGDDAFAREEEGNCEVAEANLGCA